MPAVLRPQKRDHRCVSDEHAPYPHFQGEVDEDASHGGHRCAERAYQSDETLAVEYDDEHAGDECHDGDEGHQRKDDGYVRVQQVEPLEISGPLVEGIVDLVIPVESSVGQGLEKRVVEPFGIFVHTVEVGGVYGQRGPLVRLDSSEMLHEPQRPVDVDLVVCVEMGVEDCRHAQTAHPHVIADEISVDAVSCFQSELVGGDARYHYVGVRAFLGVVGEFPFLEVAFDETSYGFTVQAPQVSPLEVVGGLEYGRDGGLEAVPRDVILLVENRGKGRGEGDEICLLYTSDAADE